MRREQMIQDILKRHRKGEINETVEERVVRGLNRLADDNLQMVIDWILDNHPSNYPLDVMNINRAINELGIGGSTSEPLTGEDWECDLCGERFKYSLCVSDDDKIKRAIFDKCPRCGFCPETTQHAHHYASLMQVLPEWYPESLKAHAVFWKSIGYARHFDKAQWEQCARDEENKKKAQIAEQQKQITKLMAGIMQDHGQALQANRRYYDR